MGSEEDPKDGKKVAVTVFGAVGIYAVRPPTHTSRHLLPRCLWAQSTSPIHAFRCRTNADPGFARRLGLPLILRMSGFPSQTSECTRRDSVTVIEEEERGRDGREGRDISGRELRA
jgi:hypothetical protein